jgi:hydrogenase maturation factor
MCLAVPGKVLTISGDEPLTNLVFEYLREMGELADLEETLQEGEPAVVAGVPDEVR